MAGKKRLAPSRSGPQKLAGGSKAAIPEVFREMLREVHREQLTTQNSDPAERPAKRKRPGEGRIAARSTTAKANEDKDMDTVNDTQGKSPGSSSMRKASTTASIPRNKEYEKPQVDSIGMPKPIIQTAVRELDEEDEDEFDDIDFEDVAIGPSASSKPESGSCQTSSGLNLNLSAHLSANANTPGRPERRKRMTREEKQRRIQVHKIHFLCLLAHVERRNWWCNDPEVQGILRSLLPEKTIGALIPRESLNQFGRTLSLKRGVQEARDAFKIKYTIMERGLRRALWAEDEKQLRNYQLPHDMESVKEKEDFIKAAKTMRGSRDVGAQLFCALLRAVGVEARLVCSLQPLPFVSTAPSMSQRDSKPEKPPKPNPIEQYEAVIAKNTTKFPQSPAGATTLNVATTLGFRSHFGRPYHYTTFYQLPQTTSPAQSPPVPPPPPVFKKIRDESAYPVYWVEVLDAGPNTWHPVDPLVTCTQWRTDCLEPPLSDLQNNMAYVIAFSADGRATDVTRRYAKAYATKTRKLRIDDPSLYPTNHLVNPNKAVMTDGERFLRLALFRYRGRITPPDQAELTELSTIESREPMPQNIIDFKDHPVYVLERHLLQNEALVPDAKPVGTLTTGSTRKKKENIYLRSDVRVVRSKEAWFRLGRVVRRDEVAVKILPRRRTTKGYTSLSAADCEDDDIDHVGLFGDSASGNIPLYMYSQTERYQAPPVQNGVVPRNSFGNIELFVPGMLPKGGVHIKHEMAGKAAWLLGVDYAPALVGFAWEGKMGRGVLKGIVVAKEYEEAVWTVIRGLEDLEREEEEDRKRRRVLAMWKYMLRGLKIRERVWANVDEGGEAEDKDEGGSMKIEEIQQEHVQVEDAEEQYNGAGGFFVPDEDNDNDQGGGFLIE